MTISVTAYHDGFALTEEQLEPAEAACPVCGSTAARTRLFAVQAEPEVWFLRCAACRAASASAMPKAGVLDELYRSMYDDVDRAVTLQCVERFAAPIVRVWGDRAVGRPVRILDFGGGDGSLAVEVARRLVGGAAPSVIIEVIDFHAVADPRDPRIVISSRGDLDPSGEPYDIVIASAILEHVPDAAGLIVALTTRVAPGGLFYARTPWAVPVRRLSSRVDMVFPGHVHDMGGDFWNRFCATFGLPARTVVSGPSPVETDLRSAAVRTAVAHVLKVPARAERALRGVHEGVPWWPLVGGWHAILRFDDDPAGAPAERS
jgi:hypothetical protein